MIDRSGLATDLVGTRLAGLRAASIVELISRQIALTPAATAIQCGDRSMTYRELDASANKIAARLRRSGFAPNNRIAVLLDRSLDMVAALYGILKAGNAFIPLDPTYPPARVAHVLSDARPSAIVSTSPIFGEIVVAPHDSIATILLDDFDSGAASILDASDARCTVADRNIADPNAVAYIIYTSGSTGAPKGVQIPHRAVVNFLCSIRDSPGLSGNDVLLAVTTIAFDIAILELFLPLTVGAKIVLAREAEVIDGATLDRLMQRNKVTVLQATPATWQLLIASGWRNPHLKMFCGGEALSRALADELLARGGELWNMYGPTETTVWSSVLRIDHEGPVLLGPPIANTYFHVLDEQLRPVAPGQPGELFIGGDGVALGYLGRPDLTAERFLTDTPAAPTQRLYRTGDIVRSRRQHSLDCLEFLGRADQQVKIRGYRIELGEIEATLLRHPSVAEAVATAGKRGDAGEPTLHAFVVLRPQVSTTKVASELIGELHAELRELLPAYMLPQTISMVARLPRTPNGKVDRKAIPDLLQFPTVTPESLRPSEDGQRREAEIEAELAAIWRSLLPHARVDATADFFSLGGSSLLAAQLLERIEERFTVRLTLPALFAAPSLGEQAQLLRDFDGRNYDFRQMVHLHTGGSRPPLFVIHNTGVYSYRLAQLLGPDQPLVALQLFDPSRDSFPATLEVIAAEYIGLIRQVRTEGPYQLLGWCIGGVLAFEIARQLSERGCAVSFVGMIDSWSPGHLRRQSRLGAWLSDRSYRMQLILTDWRKTQIGQQSVMDFFRNRVALKRLLRIAGDAHSQPMHKMFADRHLSDAHYDRWLGRYLEELAERYEPRPYAGNVKLLRSSLEPRGWFLDPLMGWGPFAANIDSEMLDGDHFTVFRGRGLKQLVGTVAASLAQARAK